MYSDLTLYYLKQLGITPWVMKQNVSNNTEQILNVIAPKIVILKKNTLNDKAEVLFRKMVNYLNLNDSELLITESLSSSSLFEKHSPQAILLLGLNSDEFVSNNFNCPVLFGNSPEDLLTNPLEKRSVFKALHSIRSLIHLD